jgi:hypothetical protein
MLPWQRVTMELLYMHFRDNARLGILVAVGLQVLPWQRVLRQAVAADTKYRILQGGVSYSGCRERSNGIGLGFVQNSLKEHATVEALKC